MPSKSIPAGLPQPATSSELTGLRLLKVPDGWPPYDCETHGAACPAARDTAATSQDADGHPPGPGAGPAPGRAQGPPASTAQPGTSPAAAGVTAAWPRQFAQVIVEILAGARPPRQLIPWTTDQVRTQIGFLTRCLAADQRPRIQRILTSQPAPDVVEMTVVVSFGPRSRALAIRFEHMPTRPAAPGLPARQARWLCTEIEAG